MYATQGFAPGSSSFVDMSSADQSDALMMATRAEGIPVPTPSPATTAADSSQQAAAQDQAAPGQPMVMAETSVDALNQGIMQSQPAQPAANLYSAQAPAPQVAAQAAAPQATAPQDAASQTVASDPAQVALRMASAELTPAIPEPGAEQAAAQPDVQELAVVAPPKKQSIFARLFAQQPKSTKKAPSGTQKRLVSAKPAPVVVASAAGGTESALPGVRMSNVFTVGDGEAESDDYDGPVQLASAAGLARLAPNGLHLQTEKVEVGCFKPELVRVLKNIERHYGRSLVVTSGYRSPKHNRRVGGASGSRHTSCEAADIQIDGVSKWQLAKYLRSMPERGGVGTYCHTESVHIDVGTPRDWNWRCRRRK
ncbi:YcbK family protein [Hoeflea sp. BAL378]|uniref:YcbK family protein n=1 Tax=Hoeflea sp. BAL378 TaxID=1547437 RepID=UPI000AC44A52|nr:YcbK family protein [Hoeflea sp. BAL378]